MQKSVIFGWLVRYHIDRNLSRCLPYIQEGQFSPPYRKSALRPGRSENEFYQGFLVVANGNTLFHRLQEDKVVLDKKAPEFLPVADMQAFFDFLDGQEDNDGAYVFNSIEGSMARVHVLNNDLPYRVDLEHIVPGDFMSYDGSVPAEAAGTKTILAGEIPQTYEDTEAFQIKRTAYNPLGFGKVTHFNEGGLAEEFFLRYDPNWTGSFIDPEHFIIGVYRAYAREQDKLVLRKERIIGNVEDLI